MNQDKLFYEDALILVFIKGVLERFTYNNQIKQVVIDEAQDYNKLQYIIITKIFKNAGITILGDVNQTINPYYMYSSLDSIAELLSGQTAYLELTKTYRSSEEIIEYSNEILDLEHVSAIRRGKNVPVIKNNSKNLKEELLSSIEYLRSKYNSVAIITKDDLMANQIYSDLKEKISISLIVENSKEFKKDMIIIPVYMAKGLEFDSVIIINTEPNKFEDNDKYLYYVAVTRAQHELIIYK